MKNQNKTLKYQVMTATTELIIPSYTLMQPKRKNLKGYKMFFSFCALEQW